MVGLWFSEDRLKRHGKKDRLWRAIADYVNPEGPDIGDDAALAAGSFIAVDLLRSAVTAWLFSPSALPRCFCRRRIEPEGVDRLIHLIVQFKLKAGAKSIGRNPFGYLVWVKG